MLFHITQTHSPEKCPKDEGGSKILYNPKVEGLTIRAIYGAFSEHVIHYIVEADNVAAIQQFLVPGFKRCTCKVSPVSEEPIAR